MTMKKMRKTKSMSKRMVDFGDSSGTLDAAVRYASSRSPFALDVKRLRDTAQYMLENRELQENIIGKEVFKECSFIFGGKQKRIDMLAFGGNEVFIVDYKSSTTPRSEHKSQIALYAKAVEAIMSIQPRTLILTAPTG